MTDLEIKIARTRKVHEFADDRILAILDVNHVEEAINAIDRVSDDHAYISARTAILLAVENQKRFDPDKPFAYTLNVTLRRSELTLLKLQYMPKRRDVED